MLRDSCPFRAGAAVVAAAALFFPSANPAWAADPAVGVTIDWQALDSLPPAPAHPPADALKLRPPPTPRAAPTPVATRPATPPPVSPPQQEAALTPPKPPAAARSPAAPSAAALPPGRIGTVPYAKGETALPPSEAGLLDHLAQLLVADRTAKLQLLSYASGSDDDTLEPRRVSLARAVQLRAYLIGKGVPSVRMDVRALGDRNAGDGPPDRVDLVVVER